MGNRFGIHLPRGTRPTPRCTCEAHGYVQIAAYAAGKVSQQPYLKNHRLQMMRPMRRPFARLPAPFTMPLDWGGEDFEMQAPRYRFVLAEVVPDAQTISNIASSGKGPYR